MKALVSIVLVTAGAFGASVANAQFVSHSPDKQTLAGRSGAQASPAAPGAGWGLMVFIDPVTGKIRQPDAEDIRALQAQQPVALRSAAMAAGPLPYALPGGGVGVKLDESFHNYVVVTKKPNGSLLMDCVPGAEKAADAVAKGLQTGETSHKKEVLDVQ